MESPTVPPVRLPNAASFGMRSQPAIPASGDDSTAQLANGQASQNDGPKPQGGTTTDSSSIPPFVGPDAGEAQKKLSNKELKSRQKAEKQAKRAAQKSAPDTRELEEPQPQQYQHGSQHRSQQSSSGQKEPPNTGKAQPGPVAKINDMTTHHKRTSSSSSRVMPLKSLVGPPLQAKHPGADVQPRQEKRVGMFSHLYSKDRRTTIAGVGREIHPAVLTLGIQLRDYDICGSNARCVATLLVFKKVIQSYTTPPSVALPRHLTTHLSHQISYLSSSRPLSTSQGNSIRWLKKLVVELDPKITDPEARLFLCKSIDQFIREKVSLADEVIAREASNKIVDGDVVLVYAKSSVVEKSLVTAHRQEKRFIVVVADSRPLFEGKNMARGLVRAGLKVQYCLLTGLASLSKKVTKCLLGASAMTENGRLYSRAGTAMVAMMAKDSSSAAGGNSSAGSVAAGSVPVIVLCESVKFSSRVLLDSIINNELGDPDALVEGRQRNSILSIPSNTTPLPSSSTGTGPANKKGKPDPDPNNNNDNDEESAKRKKQQDHSLLEDWLHQPNLHLLNLMYDVTPTEYLDMVITELGSIPPTAVSAVNGVWSGEA